MKLVATLISCFLIILVVNLFCISGTKIEIDQGWIIGAEELSEGGRTYSAFRSIPYALPPIGELRFEAPRPPLKWNETFDATKEGPLCAQAALGYEEGEEDCLHIYVYTPKQLSESGSVSGLPVLVWIPGGAFVTGGAKEYSPHLIMDKDLVLVIPQYRLGMLGFYSTRTRYAYGNYGLLDQVEALKWVQRNIAKFGGDPNQVTLGGDCAGGVSSILHMMSPLSQGLFQRVVSLSGSPLSYWTIHPRHNRLGLLISKHVKCPAYDLELLMKCFRERSVKELLENQMYTLEARDLLVGNHKLAPSIQVPANSHVSTLFLEDHPLKLLLKGDFTKVPVLLSVTRDVGSYLVDLVLYEFILDQMEKDPQYLDKIIALLVKEIDFLHHEEEAEKFEKFYFSDWDHKNVEDIIPGLTNMLGDTAFNAALLTLAKLLSKEVETRFLRFDYEEGPKIFDIRHADNPSKPPMPSTAITHGDELFFLLPHSRVNISEKDKPVVEKMLNLIDDFVNGREPLLNWPVFTPGGLETLVITAKGDIQKGVKFANKEKEEFLHYIIQHQHENALKDMEEEGEIDVGKWKHDEL